jgi:hypothetical protein
MRRVRMSAASERVGETGLATQQEVRPWTRATVDAINRDYDTLARFFPEMADLDQVVRLLSLFAWLKSASAEGHLLPELETLLAIELPQLSTPRTYPQLLAFNALPPPGSPDRVAVFDRVRVGEALDRLSPASGRPLPARRRYQRAVGALDPTRKEHAALLAKFEGYGVERLDDSGLDVLAQQAERVRMHETVLATLEMPRRREIAQRLEAGEQLRMFSVGIGGPGVSAWQQVVPGWQDPPAAPRRPVRPAHSSGSRSREKSGEAIRTGCRRSRCRITAWAARPAAVRSRENSVITGSGSAWRRGAGALRPSEPGCRRSTAQTPRTRAHGGSF